MSLKSEVLTRSSVAVQADLEFVQVEDICTDRQKVPSNLSITTDSLRTDEVIRLSASRPRPSLKLLDAFYQDLELASTKDEVEKCVPVNDVLIALSGIAQAKPTHDAHNSAKTSHSYDGCYKAEYQFARSLHQIQEGRGPQRQLSVYHDESGFPLLIRKDIEEDTALTLTGFAIGDLAIPAGTLVVVDDRMDEDTLSGYNRDHGFEMRTFTATDVRITPLRPSAWA